MCSYLFIARKGLVWAAQKHWLLVISLCRPITVETRDFHQRGDRFPGRLEESGMSVRESTSRQEVKQLGPSPRSIKQHIDCGRFMTPRGSPGIASSGTSKEMRSNHSRRGGRP